MLSYKTFRWRIHENTPADIDTVLNALLVATIVEGYACTGDEIYVTVSHYDPYARHVEKEVAKLGLRDAKQAEI